MDKKILFIVSVMILIQSLALASVTVTVSQSGADSGTVMAGKTFTVTASGWTGDCTSAYLDLSDCGVCNVSESQTKSLTGSSVSWTTLTASRASGQEITVSVSGTCSPDSGSSTFDVKTQPSLSATVSPSSTSVNRGGIFSLSLDIQNNGETTAQFGGISVSPSDFSISSGCSPSSIIGSQSSGLTCGIAASSSATLGSRTLTLTISPSNADSISKTVDVQVNSVSTNNTTSSSGGVTGGEDSNISYAVKIWTALYPETPVSWEINKANIAITKIDISVNKLMRTVKLTLDNISTRPSSVKPISGEVYQYLNITSQNVDASDLKSVKIKFRIEKKWILDKNLDENTVSLNRYYNGNWSKLNTTKVDETAIYIYYEAETPGFSYFAITANKLGATVCGNGVCETGETYETCSSDCNKPSEAPVCGNGVCETGESCGKCLRDCPCASGYSCQDNVCKSGKVQKKLPLKEITIVVLILITIAVITWLIKSLKEDKGNEVYRFPLMGPEEKEEETIVETEEEKQKKRGRPKKE